MAPFSPPPPTYRGPGSVAELPSIPAVRRSENPVVVTDEGVRAAGVTDAVASHLASPTLYDDVTPNPDVETVRDVARELSGADLVVGVGGGSVMDAAKAGRALDAVRSFETLLEASPTDALGNPEETIPLLLVPTTAGTGTETGHWAVVSDHDRGLKRSVGNPLLGPDAAVLDPELTLSVPAYVTAATGFDVLTHAVESLTATGATPLTRPYGREAYHLAVSTLERTVNNGEDVRARARMLDASFLAGLSMNNAGLGAVHAISHAVGGLYDTPHGHTNALLLPAIVRENARRSPEARNVYARLVGEDDDPGEELAARLETLCDAVELDRSLPKAPDTWDWDAVAERALSNVNVETNPAPMDRETVIEVCRGALDD
jgi:alcohol dehydrogenase class IV